jgi:pimeloyl-ACP methyl ester carboxylesterase
VCEIARIRPNFPAECLTLLAGGHNGTSGLRANRPSLSRVDGANVERREVILHGHRVSYTEAGSSREPLVVLIHGVAGNSGTWDDAIYTLQRSVHVIAPDLLGHGESAKPRGDYSLGAYASGIRDLLQVLGHDRATIVGHSLGGGIAMQFAYQFPERCERLGLVSSGGLGHEVTPWLRMATLPWAEWVLPVIANGYLHRLGKATGSLFGRVPLLALSPSIREIAGGYASLADTQARAAFVHTLRSVMDVTGQRVNALDRLYLAADMPTLVVWGGRDPFIPLRHAERAAHLIPGSRLEVFDDAGHFPHRDEPERFARVLLHFIAETQPAQSDHETLRNRLLERADLAPNPEESTETPTHVAAGGGGGVGPPPDRHGHGGDAAAVEMAG